MHKAKSFKLGMIISDGETKANSFELLFLFFINTGYKVSLYVSNATIMKNSQGDRVIIQEVK